MMLSKFYKKFVNKGLDWRKKTLIVAVHQVMNKAKSDK